MELGVVFAAAIAREEELGRELGGSTDVALQDVVAVLQLHRVVGTLVQDLLQLGVGVGRRLLPLGIRESLVLHHIALDVSAQVVDLRSGLPIPGLHYINTDQQVGAVRIQGGEDEAQHGAHRVGHQGHLRPAVLLHHAQDYAQVVHEVVCNPLGQLRGVSVAGQVDAEHSQVLR